MGVVVVCSNTLTREARQKKIRRKPMHFAGDLSEKEELRNSQKSEKARKPSPLQRRKDVGDTWKKPVNYRAESPLKSKSPSPPRRKKRSCEHERLSLIHI